MNIDNSISLARVKKALTSKTVLIVSVIVAVLSTIFYITLENRDSKELLVWYITTEAEYPFSEETLGLVNEYGVEVGLDKILLTRRHPEDQYFDAAMSTTAFYNCDIFIMKEEMINKYAEAGMFLTLSDYGNDENEMFYVGEDAVGVKLDNDYYLLINKKTDIDLQIIYDIFDIFIGN